MDYSTQDAYAASIAESPSSLTCPPQTTVDFHNFRSVFCDTCSYTVIFPVSCGNRFCSVCGPSRRSKVRDRLDWLVSQIPQKRGYIFKFLTLTIRNQPVLADMIKHLIKSFRKLRNRAYWQNRVIGGVYVLEITGRPGNWHAHIHAVLLAQFLTWEVLVRHWIKCSGSRGVYIKNAAKHRIVYYITKYLSKPADVPDEVINQAGESLRGLRLFSPFGAWYSISSKYVQPSHPCPECGGEHWIIGNAFDYVNNPTNCFRTFSWSVTDWYEYIRKRKTT